MNYTLTEKNVLPIYEHARKLDNFRVLIYNGDTDPGINSMITQVCVCVCVRARAVGAGWVSNQQSSKPNGKPAHPPPQQTPIHAQ